MCTVEAGSPTCVPDPEAWVLGQILELLKEENVIGALIGVQQGQLGVIVGLFEHRLDDLVHGRDAPGGAGGPV